jgi:hypothetical protein
MTNTTQRSTDLLRQQPLLIAGLAFILGLIIGLPVLGWWLWPVKWVNASFSDLRAADQQEYVRLVASDYALKPDSDKAATRIQALGPNASKVISDTIASTTGEDAIRVAQLKQVLEFTGALEPSGEAGPTTATGSLLNRVRPVLLACSLLVVLLLGAAGAWYLWNTGALKRVTQPRPAAAGASAATTMVSRSTRAAAAAQTAERQAAPGAAASPTGQAPVAQFMTTYVLGDDLYDDSFSIDGPDGSFLGECGMGISETIGVGDPKKVMAFEVWLFDKNDIRTVTKVLMSEHAFRDEALKSRLAAKGEPVLVQQGDVVSMETASLVVSARVVDMAYGGGALPPNSYFERLTIELAAYSKAQVPAA